MSSTDDDIVIDVLKNTRKPRKQATCFPCQRRKVRCDRGLPCSVCVARGHSFLCSYGQPQERRAPTHAVAGIKSSEQEPESTEKVTIEVSKLALLRRELSQLRHELQQTRARHRRCQAAQNELRQLRTRCKEYETLHTRLGPGNWNVLATLGNLPNADIPNSDNVFDCSRESDSASTSSNGGSCTLGHVTPEYRPNGDTKDLSLAKTPSLGMSPTSANNATYADPSELSTAVSSDQSMPHSSQVLQPGADFHNAGLCYSLPMVESDPLDGQSEVQQSCATFEAMSLLPISDNVNKMIAATDCMLASRSVQPVPSSIQPVLVKDVSVACENGSIHAPGPPKYIEAMREAVPRFCCHLLADAQSSLEMTGVPGLVKPHARTTWIRDPSYPPMTFYQCSDSMERSYEEYWSNISISSDS